VVTANKAMLALHGPRLAALAEQNNATIGAHDYNTAPPLAGRAGA
jgi:homoserine dehydrogenase